MTGPAVNLAKLRQQLGPDFDVRQLEQLFASGVADHMPADMKEAARQLIQQEQTRRQVSNPASADAVARPMFHAPTGEGPDIMMQGIGMLARGLMQTGARAAAGGVMTGNPVSGIIPGMEQTPAAKQTSAAVAAVTGQLPPQIAALYAGPEGQNLMREFGHQMSAGIMDAPQIKDPRAQEAWNDIVRPVVSIGAMTLQGGAVFRALGYVTKLPVAAPMLEMLGQRMTEVGIGAVTAGTVDAMRAEGLPQEPGTLDVSGRLGRKLADLGVPDRLALGIGGAVLGGVVGGTLLGIARGIKLGRNSYFAASLDDATLAAMRKALIETGVEVPSTMSPRDVTRVFASMKRVVMDEDLAGLVGDRLAREDYIMQELWGTANVAPSSEDSRALAGMFRMNTGGTTVITGITDTQAVDQASAKLGLRLQYQRIRRGERLLEDGTKQPVYDLLVSRPVYEYPTADKVAGKIGAAMSKLSTENSSTLGAVVSKEAFLLADGTPIRGNFTMAQLEKRVRLQHPMVGGVERPDLSLRMQGGVARMVLGDNNSIRVELPGRMTHDQFESFGRMFNASHFDTVELVSMDGTLTKMEGPLGAQVQDAIAGIVKPIKVGSRLTADLVKQYKGQGVFKGQAAILTDGTPAEIVGKRGLFFEVRDPLTNEIRRIHPSKITAIPTTLEGEMRPNNLFLQHLEPEERATLARLRQALQQDLGTEIKTFRQMESFANTRGFTADQLKGGAVKLSHALSGESQTFKNQRAAIEFVRKSTGPMPELTPPEITKLLGGDTNLGVLGGGGPAPRFGETMPLDWNRIRSRLETMSVDRGPGAWESIHKPSLTLMADLDKRLGTSNLPVFMRLQTQKVAETNFKALWYKGLGGKLPEGVLPLRDIEVLAGKDANWETIHAWLESAKGSPDEQALWKTLTTGEQRAAQEGRKWFDALFKEFGIEADYLENYMPHWRQMAPTHGNDPLTIWKATGGDPLNPPKGAVFYADHYRNGTLDVYDTHFMRVAASYLEKGAANRFMKEAFDDAQKVVMMTAARNRAAAEPLGRIVYAMKGLEFIDQQSALQESMKGILDKLPGIANEGAIGSVADRMANTVLGMVYTSALGARPSVAMKNAFSVFGMVWPVFGGSKGDFVEALGRALTREGKDAATAANAIALKASAVAMREEITTLMPKELERFTDASMYLYDSADEFTRATAFHAGKLKAEKALAQFGKAVQGDLSKDGITAAKLKVERDAGLWLSDRQVIDEFWRKAAANPEDATRFAGKQAADLTNFLYGRGMQPRWLRSVPGRFVGQFGTWSLWYVDHLKRLAAAATRSGHQGAAIAALGRHAILQAALIVTGKKVLDIDLSRWANYGSIFYSGGPGFQMAMGASTLMRGMGEVSSANEDPMAQQRVQAGAAMIGYTMRSFLPYFGVVKDATNLASADDWTEAAAAALGTKVTRQYDTEQRLQAMFGPQKPFLTSSPVVEDVLNGLAGVGEAPVDIREVATLRRQAGQQLQPLPQGAVTTTGQSPQGQQAQPPAPMKPVPTTVPPGTAYHSTGEATGSIESRPSTGF